MEMAHGSPAGHRGCSGATPGLHSGFAHLPRTFRSFLGISLGFHSKTCVSPRESSSSAFSPSRPLLQTCCDAFINSNKIRNTYFLACLGPVGPSKPGFLHDLAKVSSNLEATRQAGGGLRLPGAHDAAWPEEKPPPSPTSP